VVALLLGLPRFELFGHWGEVFGDFMHPVFAQALGILHAEGGEAAEHVALWPFAVAWGVALVSGGLAFTMYIGNLKEVPGKLARAFPGLYQFGVDKFRVDELYDLFVVKLVRNGSWVLWKVVDRIIIEGIFVNGLPWVVGRLGRFFRLGQNGDLQRYAAVIAVAAAVVLWVVLGTGAR